MSWHPLVLSIWLTDLIAWGIYLAAAVRLTAVLPHWRPDAADASQLRRERALELVSYQGRWVMAMQAVAFVLMLVGISNVWPACVPGAMCGTGVLQAMGAAGEQSLIFRGLTLLLLYCWMTAEQIDQTCTQPLSAPLHGRLLLLAAPLMALSSWTFAEALGATAALAPVSCCAVIYDQVLAAGRPETSASALLPVRVWMPACFGGTILMAAWGWRQWRLPHAGGGGWSALTGGLTVAWSGAALMGLKTGVAPYVYQVLYHPCPWCFFLTGHGAPGFILFGLPAWIIAETAAGLTARGIARRYPILADPARRRMARAGFRIFVCALVFALAAAAPPLLWRLRFGAWIR